MPLSVRILYTDGCANTEPTIQRIREVAQDLRIAICVDLVQVTTHQQADAWRFLGSPTVQIDGRDIDPAARTATVFGFT
jgi:hypothetical protein